MAIIRRAEVDNVGFGVGDATDPTDLIGRGTLAVRWAKLTYDGEVLLARDNHRATISPGDDFDAFMGAINADLVNQGYGAMPDSDVDYLRREVTDIRTPQVMSAWQAKADADKALADAQAVTLRKLLPKWRFDAQLEISGLGTSLDAVLAGIKDVTKRAIIRSRLAAADPVNRDDPEFGEGDLLTAMHMTPADVDAFWDAAWALSEVA